jgi:hypothetical protein
MTANVLITADTLAREGVMALERTIVSPRLVYRDATQDFTGGAKGDTVVLRKPSTFVADEFDGDTTLQYGAESSVNLTLDYHFDVSFPLTARDLTLSLDDFTGQFVAPAMRAISKSVGDYVASQYIGIPYFAGTAGTPPAELADLTGPGEVLDSNFAPPDDRFGLVSSRTKASMLSIPEVVSAEKRGDNGTALRTASVGNVMNIEYFMDHTVKTHTCGTWQAGTCVVDGDVDADATTMDIDGGVGTETLLKGDIFTVAGVTGQYVVTANATATAGAATGVAFYPAAPTGGFPDDSAITIIASHTANIIAHPHAIALALVPPNVPRSNVDAAYMNYNGVSMRVVIGWDPAKQQDVVSFGVLAGAALIQPELACRLLG